MPTEYIIHRHFYIDVRNYISNALPAHLFTFCQYQLIIIHVWNIFLEQRNLMLF